MGFCTNVIQCTFTTTTQNTKITFRSEPVCVWTKAALVKFFNATLSGFLSHLRFALSCQNFQLSALAGTASTIDQVYVCHHFPKHISLWCWKLQFSFFYYKTVVGKKLSISTVSF